MRRRGATAGRRRLRAAGAALAAWSLVLQGCYESLPLQQGPAPVARRVELVLNDRGRAALADKLGPAVDKLEGEIVSEDDGSYNMSVFHVRQLNGSSATWNGEQVSVPKENTNGYQIRRLNRTRTALLAGVVTAATVVLIFGKSLNLFGGGAETPTSPEPGPHAR